MDARSTTHSEKVCYFTLFTTTAEVVSSSALAVIAVLNGHGLGHSAFIASG